MAITIATVNRKGGVGKTSTVFHLGGAWSQDGQRVLLVDADPQHSLSAGFLGTDDADALAPASTIAALFDDHLDPPPRELIQTTSYPGLDLLAGSDALGPHNHADYARTGPYQLTLRDLVEAVGADYDVIVFDCPPNLQLLTWCALAAADQVLVPMQPEDFGCQGAKAVQQVLAEARRVINPNLELAGYLLNQVKPRTAIHRAYESVLRNFHGRAVLETVLPDAIHFKESISERRPVTLYRPRSAAARAVRALAAEILERVHFTASPSQESTERRAA